MACGRRSPGVPGSGGPRSSIVILCPKASRSPHPRRRFPLHQAYPHRRLPSAEVSSCRGFTSRGIRRTMVGSRKTRFWVCRYGESRMSSRRLVPFAIVLLCAAVPLSFADQVVYFVNGKAIMVKSVEKGEKFTIPEMEGGGKVGVPTDQISKIEDFAITAPQAVPAQSAPVPAAVAPIVAAGPAPAAAPPAVASALPTDPSMAAGPGIGGRPAGGPDDNLAHIKPLDIGGNSGAGPIQRPYPQATAGPGGRPGGPMLGMAARQSLAAGRRFGRGMNGGGRGGRPG